jgi:hypothetical protein
VNLLAAARVFLSGARDVRFVVALPVFLYAQGWTFAMLGTFLALWTIGYGIVQARPQRWFAAAPTGSPARYQQLDGGHWRSPCSPRHWR